MKLRILSLAFASGQLACGLHAQTSSDSNTNPTKSKTELISDIQVVSDGGHIAESARRFVVQSRQIDVITAGLTSASYNVKGNCVTSLSLFSVDQQKQALATALGKDSAWEEEFPGESREGQESVCQQIVEILKGFKIDATWKDLLNPVARKSIINQLIPAN